MTGAEKVRHDGTYSPASTSEDDRMKVEYGSRSSSPPLSQIARTSPPRDSLAAPRVGSLQHIRHPMAAGPADAACGHDVVWLARLGSTAARQPLVWSGSV